MNALDRFKAVERIPGWQFRKMSGGYRRTQYKNAPVRYMTKVFESNRTWIHKIWFQLCKYLGHKIDMVTCSEYGFHQEKYGSYFVSFCPRCRTEVIFYEGNDR